MRSWFLPNRRTRRWPDAQVAGAIEQVSVHSLDSELTDG